MDNLDKLDESVKKLSQDLRSFIELSLRESDSIWEEWISRVKDRQLATRCWEKKECGKTACPAYMNTCGRCWLIAGTMCGGEVVGRFAQKYGTCCECEVYQEAVFKDPVSEMYEHVITLVHSLRAKQDDLRQMATKDSLTGLFNRNFFELSIEREIEKIRRLGFKPMLIMIDIDKFKYVNDTYGHLEGDKVLKESAAILNTAVRSSDLLVRYGGDEFLILLPAATGMEMEALMGRIEKHTAEWNSCWATPDYSLSFSVGHAVLEPDSDLRRTIDAADVLMYENKMKKRG